MKNYFEGGLKKEFTSVKWDKVERNRKGIEKHFLFPMQEMGV
jgi:hypothetical protein